MAFSGEDVVRRAMVDTPEIVPLIGQVSAAVLEAIHRVRPDLTGADPLIRPSEHADFQANAALALAKRAKTSPGEFAAAIVGVLGSGGAGRFALDAAGGSLIRSAVVSGPGFVNIEVSNRAVWEQMARRLDDPRSGVGVPEAGRRIVIDYSAPNIAKEMHVGHLRTTIIGDCLARILTFLGADVVRQNHLGDWGTQFGMLIQYLDEHPGAAWHQDELTGTSSVSALATLYKEAKGQFDADPAFADQSRARVVALQAGEPASTARWQEIVAESEKAFRAIYHRLSVLLTPEDSVGESFYQPMLADTIAELEAAGIAVLSDGALVVFSEEVTGPDGGPVPLMVRKRDGGYGYDTTDLATIRYRIKELGASRLIYVTDARQALHFRMIFDAARRAGWLTPDIEATHVAYGMVLGADGRPFRSREGDTVRLVDLLDAAVERARDIVAEKNPDLAPADLDRIAEQAGTGAVKYADLCTSRGKDYVFDVDRMVSFTGNTGVYLQYAHTRMAAILRKAGAAEGEIDPSVRLQPQERTLALRLDAYGTVVAEAGSALEPHRLCGYLYDLARDFTAFYEACHVLSADEPVRTNRLALCRLAARTMRHGLDLLGIAAPERM